MLWPAVDSMLKDVMFTAYTSDVREAWRTIFDFLIERMEIGMREAQQKKAQAEEKQWDSFQLASSRMNCLYSETCIDRPLNFVVFQDRWSFTTGRIHMIL